MRTHQEVSRAESLSGWKGWRVGLDRTEGPEQILLPAKVIRLDLENPIRDEYIGDPYRSAYLLVCWRGVPAGHLCIPLQDGWLRAEFAGARILDRIAEALRKHLIRAELSNESWNYNAAPFISIVVCSRNRAEELRQCLRGLAALDYKNFEVIVVDNAPSDDTTERLVKEAFPEVRYIREPKPGLDWARNRGVEAARGKIIAFTDDDVRVDPSWLRALARAFRRPEVSAVTGLVLPAELETPAQALFELIGGFNRGYRRRYAHAGREASPRAFSHLGAGEYGTGANMAFRRKVFDRILGFDPALDVGTPAEGAGDLEFFFRVVEEGMLLLYDPAVLVWHRHRRESDVLRRQLATWSKGLHAFLEQAARRYPHLAPGVKNLKRWWKKLYRQRLKDCRRRPGDIPADLFLGFLENTGNGLEVYRRSAERTEAIIREFEVSDGLSYQTWIRLKKGGRANQQAETTNRITAGSRLELDLSSPLSDWEEGRHCATVELVFREGSQLIGRTHLQNDGFPLSRERLADLAAEAIHRYLKDNPQSRRRGKNTADMNARLQKEIQIETASATASTKKRRASIIIATYDRPGTLRACLDSILRHRTSTEYEIIVVDNHPDSGQSAFARDYHPRVRYLEERRKGLSYARNAGFRAAEAEVVVATDDDVEVADDWLDQLMQHFHRSDVMGVTGNVLPFRLENQAHQLFESYGGLGRGFVRREYGPHWLQQRRYRPAPTWEIGATANAAFRRSALNNPQIGYLLEYLGAGVPTGCSEDTHLFYRILRSGYTIVYEPDAFVYHKHRNTLDAFRKQVYNYSKGHVAYLLVTIFREGDHRGWYRLFGILPAWHLRRLLGKGLGNYSRRYVLWEIWGNLTGPFALWRAYRRTKSARKGSE